jgi:hypothetical protein
LNQTSRAGASPGRREPVEHVLATGHHLRGRPAFFRPFAFAAGAKPAMAKSSSFFPDLKAVVNHRGFSPRPAAKNFPTRTRSPTARGSPIQAIRHGTILPSLQRNEIGTSESDQLNTWPVVSPENASRLPFRVELRASLGSGRLARPSPWGTFTSYSLPASWRTPLRVRGGPKMMSQITEAFARSGRAAFRHLSLYCGA